jgi:hypothetical protein
MTTKACSRAKLLSSYKSGNRESDRKELRIRNNSPYLQWSSSPNKAHLPIVYSNFESINELFHWRQSPHDSISSICVHCLPCGGPHFQYMYLLRGVHFNPSHNTHHKTRLILIPSPQSCKDLYIHFTNISSVTSMYQVNKTGKILCFYGTNTVVSKWDFICIRMCMCPLTSFWHLVDIQSPLVSFHPLLALKSTHCPRVVWPGQKN